MKSILLTLAVTAALAGCGTLKEKQELLLKPKLINESAETTSPAYRAQELQRSAYYAAMEAGMKPTATPEEISLWISWGVSLTIAECRSWFHRIDDTNRQFSLGSKNVSVLENAGTAVLGLAGAASNVVAGYGVATTMLSGLGDNFNSAFLSAPSQKNVESKVMEVMDTYSKQLKEKSKELTAPEVFTYLGVLADFCTSPAIKMIVDGSMQQTSQTITPAGTITTVAKNTQVSAYLRDDSSERISAFWNPGGKLNQTNYDAIDAWLKHRGISNSVTFFSSAKLYETERKQMINDLAIPPITLPVTLGEIK